MYLIILLLMKHSELKPFDRLLQIMDELRDGCPWDRKQTFESLRRLTIEETYELAEAITKNDLQEIKKEIGDLLLHIVFYAKIGTELNAFTMDDVINSLCEKLIYRHPHIYGDVTVADDEEVKKNWEDLKLKEGNKSVLGGVPSSLPAMVKANRIQEKARGVGFDWEIRNQVWDKVREELAELQDEADKTNNFVKTEAEFGDLLFSVINAARLYQVDPELALERTNQKFISRFNYLETQTIKKGQSLHDMSLDEMNKIWEEAKQLESK
jgi:MazG family protein